MIDHHEKFRIPDINKERDWFLEVNWNPKDKKTNDCKVLKITHPDGKESLVDKKHLVSVLFAIGNAAEQRDMVPQKQTLTKVYETVVSVKSKKRIEKGENITFPIRLNIPVSQQDVIGTVQKKREHIGEGTPLIKPL